MNGTPSPAAAVGSESRITVHRAPSQIASIVRRLLLLLVVSFFLAAFSLYVWPTVYRYDHISVEGETYPVRIHRATGMAEILVPDAGWIEAGDDWNGEGIPPNTGRV